MPCSVTLYAVVTSTTTNVTVSNHELGIQGHLAIKHSYQVHKLVLLHSQFDRQLKTKQWQGEEISSYFSTMFHLSLL